MNEGFSDEQIKNLQSREFIYIKKFNRFLNDKREYSHILRSIKYYEFNKFEIIDKGYETEIIPDIDFLNLIEELNKHLENKISLNKIQLFITKENDNEINLNTYLPDVLKGCSIGYKLYKLIINYYDYISSNKYASSDAINLWYNLLQDNNLYCITSNHFSYAINKNINNEKIKIILNKIKNRKEILFDEVQFDDDTKLKIDEIFGSFENYKN